MKVKTKLTEVEKVKWAMMRSSNVKEVADMLHYKLGINDIEIFESTIDDKEGNNVCDIWVLEFEAALWKVYALMQAFKLKNVRGYLM